MVDRKYIEKNINIIFDFEERNVKNNALFHYVQTFREINVVAKDGSRSIRYPSGDRPFGDRPLMDLQLNPNDNWNLEWDTYTYLKKFYNGIEYSPESRKIFVNILERRLSNLGAVAVSTYVKSPAMVFTNRDLHSDSSLAFYFLLKIGNNDAIIRALKAKMKESMHLDTYTDSEETIEFEAYECIYEIEGLFNDIFNFCGDH